MPCNHRASGLSPNLRIDRTDVRTIELRRRFTETLRTPPRLPAAADILELVGTLAGDSSATATLQALAALAGQLDGASTLTATIQGTGNLQGLGPGAASAVASLSALVEVTGSITGDATAQATLQGLATLAAVAAGTGSLSGTLSAAVAGDLAGTLAGSAAASALLTALVNMTGTATGDAQASAVLSALATLVGSASAQAQASAIVSAFASLEGTGSGLSTLSGTPSALAALAGTGAGSATLSGDITDVGGGDNTPVIGIWRHTNAQIVTATPTKVNFDTEERNDGYTVSGDDILLPTGRFLVIYQTAWIASGVNNRGQIVGRVSINGSVQDGSHSSGYQRNTQNDAAWAIGHAVVNATAGDALSVEIFRDANSSVGGLNGNLSWLKIVSLDDSQDFAYYTLASSSALGATTYATVPLATGTEIGTSISRTGNDVSLAAGKYLICGGVHFTNGGSRTSRFTRFLLDSTHVPGSTGYSYQRNASNEFCSPNSFAIVDIASTQTLNLQARGPGPGGTPVSGSAQSDSAGLWVVRLPDAARFFSSTDTVAGQNVGTTSTTLNINETTVRSDANVVSSSTTTSATLAADMDLLVATGAMVRRTSSNGTRLTREVRLLVNGSETTPVTIASGEYNRGDQGTQDCYDSAHVVRGIFSGTTGQVLSVSIDESRDSGWDNGGGNPLTNATEAPGFYLLDLATVQG